MGVFAYKLVPSFGRGLPAPCVPFGGWWLLLETGTGVGVASVSIVLRDGNTGLCGNCLLCQGRCHYLDPERGRARVEVTRPSAVGGGSGSLCTCGHFRRARREARTEPAAGKMSLGAARDRLPVGRWVAVCRSVRRQSFLCAVGRCPCPLCPEGALEQIA